MTSRFAVVPSRAVVDPTLGNGPLRVLLILGVHADRTGWCWPQQSTIADRLNLSKSTVSMHIKTLIDLGYVEVGENHGRGLRYRVRFDLPDEAASSSHSNSEFAPGSNSEFAPGSNSQLADHSLSFNDPKNECIDRSGSGPATQSLLDVPIDADPFWLNDPATLRRLRAGNVPDDLLEPAYLKTVDALTDGSEVFWDDELLKYQRWWEDQPPSGRHRVRRRGFDRWLAKALASDRTRGRREAERRGRNGHAQTIR